jgi:hypothetical protein
MPAIEIAAFDWDEDNEPHCTAHGVWPDDLEDARMSGQYTVVRNRKGRTASHLFIGRDRSGRCITAAILAKSSHDTWRPISAWPCKRQEEQVLERYV